MYKLIFAGAMAITMTMTASAHVWNRPAIQKIDHTGRHIKPCPISYDFKRGFCVKTPASKMAWFARAVEDIL